jgi:hypothetical protein
MKTFSHLFQILPEDIPFIKMPNSAGLPGTDTTMYQWIAAANISILMMGKMFGRRVGNHVKRSWTVMNAGMG